MKIGILGSGQIGSTLGRHLARAGHTIFFSSRHPKDLQKLAEEVGSGAQAGTLEDAVKFGEVLVLAIPWRDKESLPEPDLFKGKVVIDAMNAYSAFGRVMDLGETTSSEEVAKLLPGARLIKAFNTMGSNDLGSGAFKSGKDRLAIFVAGDDAEAERIVSGLIEEIGFVPIYTGPLRDGGRLQQPGSPIYGRRLTEEQALAALLSLKN
jgi:predicted dinucleotide-binding enzyme